MSSATSKTCWAFDLDGVLVDSRPAVEASYEWAGVTMPAYAWGVSWREWLPGLSEHPQAVHNVKQARYFDLIERGEVPELPGAAMARALERDGHHVFVVTSASTVAASVLVRKIGLRSDVFTGEFKQTELKRTERVKTLRQIRTRYPELTHFTYIDDRLEGQQIAHEAGWRFGHAQWM